MAIRSSTAIIRSSTTIVTASWQADSVAGSPAAIVIAKRLIEAHIVADAGATIVAAAGHAADKRCERYQDQCAPRPTIH
jgi:hypothetical protein